MRDHLAAALAASTHRLNSLKATQVAYLACEESMSRPFYDLSSSYAPITPPNTAIRGLSDYQQLHYGRPLALLDAVAARLHKDGIHVESPTDNIVVTNHSSALLFTKAVQYFRQLHPEKAIVFSLPSWQGHTAIFKKHAANHCLLMETDISQYTFKAPQMHQAVEMYGADNIAAFFQVIPQNPVFQVYSPQDMRDIADFMHKYPQIMVVVDELYANTAHDVDAHNNSLAAVDGINPAQLLIINGTSKSLNLYCGSKLGYCFSGNYELIRALQKSVHQDERFNFNNKHFRVAAAVLAQKQTDYFAANSAYLAKRKTAFTELLQQGQEAVQYPGLAPSIFTPDTQAGYFSNIIFPDVFTGGAAEDPLAIYKTLYQQLGIKVLPGAVMGLPANTARINFCTEPDAMTSALDRILTWGQQNG